MITNFKLYESQRSDDALKLFFALYEIVQNSDFYFNIRVEDDFKNTKLPEEFHEEYKLLYFYYFDRGYKLALYNYNDYHSTHSIETPMNRLDNNYIKGQVKKYVKEKIIKKYYNNDDLYKELERLVFINNPKDFDQHFTHQNIYISSVFNMIMKTLPHRLKQIKKFKI